MFARFDQDAKLAVYFACILAAHQRKKSIGQEELLAGLTWRQHASDCEFRGLKDDCDRLWSGVGIPHLPITSEPYAPKTIPLASDSKRVIALSKLEADLSEEYLIDIDHLLLGMLREDGLGAKVLRNAGWTSERIKAARLSSETLYPSKPLPLERRLRRYCWLGARKVRKYRWVVWMLIGFLCVSAILYLRSQNS